MLTEADSLDDKVGETVEAADHALFYVQVEMFLKISFALYHSSFIQDAIRWTFTVADAGCSRTTYTSTSTLTLGAAILQYLEPRRRYSGSSSRQSLRIRQYSPSTHSDDSGACVRHARSWQLHAHSA